MAQVETIVEIAKQAGVSATTVSMVINGKGDRYRISKKTQEKVQAIVKELDFQPNQQARSLRTRRTATLGLIVADLSAHYFAHLAKGVENAAREAGYQLLIADANNDAKRERELITQLQLRGIDGLLVATSQQEWEADWNGPLVFIDRGLDSAHSSVCSENEQATYELAKNMFKSGLFAEQICYIGGDLAVSTARERWTGFRCALIDHGINPNEVQAFHGNFSQSWGFDCMKAIAQNGNETSTIFLAAQMFTEGMLEYWRHSGNQIPEDMRFCAFDDHPFYDYLPMPISSVEQNIPALAQQSVRALVEHIEDSESEVRSHRIPGILHLRHGDV